jgi:hypothetical protein
MKTKRPKPRPRRPTESERNIALREHVAVLASQVRRLLEEKRLLQEMLAEKRI